MNTLNIVRSVIWVNYFFAFDAIEVRLSFLRGKRDDDLKTSSEAYKNRVFPLIVNLFSNKQEDILSERDAAFGYIAEVMTEYAKLLIKSRHPSLEEIQEQMDAVENQKPEGLNLDRIRGYLDALLGEDGTAHYFSYNDLDIHKDIYKIWPKDMSVRLGLLSDVYEDYCVELKKNDAFWKKNAPGISAQTIQTGVHENERKRPKRTPVAAAQQLMIGAKEFMSHTGVAVCFELLKEEARGKVLDAIRDEGIINLELLNREFPDQPDVLRRLVIKNIVSADRHLDCLIIDFMKALILLQLDVKAARAGCLDWDISKKIIHARHCEQRGLGQGFRYRYSSYWKLLEDVVKYCGNNDKPKVLKHVPLPDLPPRKSVDGKITYACF